MQGLTSRSKYVNLLREKTADIEKREEILAQKSQGSFRRLSEVPGGNPAIWSMARDDTWWQGHDWIIKSHRILGQKLTLW